MKIPIWHILLLLLYCSWLQAQNINVDSLERAVNQYPKEDTVLVKKLHALANAIPNNQKEKAETIYLQAEKLASKIGWKKGEAYSLIFISNFYGNQKQFDNSISAGLKAIDIAAELYDSLLMSEIDLSMGNTYRYMGDNKQAETYALRAMKIGRANKNELIILRAYNLLLDIYSSQGKWEIVHFYADTVMKLANQLNDTYTTEHILRLLAEEQTEKQNYAKANEYNLQALKRFKERDNLVMISYTSSRLSINYAAMTELDSAFYYAKQSLDLCLQNKFDPDAAYEAYYRAYYASNDYKNALKYYLLYDSCVHASYNMQAGQNVADVNAKSNQDKRDAIANAEITRQQLIRNGSLLVLGIVALFALIFLWQRNKTKKEKLRAEKALTNLKSTQSQLIQSEKMASLGELTAGIAHEIQNPLNFVNNFSEVSNELIDEMQEELEKGDVEEAKAISAVIKQNLEKIAHHGKRASVIVKGMLAHSRSGKGEKATTDINALAEEYLKLSYHGLRAKDKSFKADFKTDFDPNLPKVNVVPQDIGRVLLNLINNAFQACTERSRSAAVQPLITVSTRSLGDKIEISVKDNGPGIPDEIKDKIFQPFFTTKPTGQGTGLGLSLSYDIVKAHGGVLSFRISKDGYTEFILSIPENMSRTK